MPNQSEREHLLERLATISEEIGRIKQERAEAPKPIDQRLDELHVDRNACRALLAEPVVAITSNGESNGAHANGVPPLRAHDIKNGQAKPNRFAKPAAQLGAQSQQILGYFHGDVLKTADLVALATKDGMGKSSCYGVLSILVKQKHLSKAGPGEYYRPERK